MILVAYEVDGRIIGFLSAPDETGVASLEADARENGFTYWITLPGQERPDPTTMRVADGALVDAPPPDPQVAVATVREAMTAPRSHLLIALANEGLITEDEAVAAAASGALPSVVEAALSGMSPADRFRSRVLWASAQMVNRNDPLVLALAAHAGMTPEDLDSLFAASL